MLNACVEGSERNPACRVTPPVYARESCSGKRTGTGVLFGSARGDRQQEVKSGLQIGLPFDDGAVEECGGGQGVLPLHSRRIESGEIPENIVAQAASLFALEASAGCPAGV